MSDPRADLRSIVRLLDDEHPMVRSAVRGRLATFGADLAEALRDAVPGLPEREVNLAVELGRQESRKELLLAWQLWLGQPTGLEKLERGHCLLAGYLASAGGEATDIAEVLSQLAMDHELEVGEPDFRSLASYLFGSGRFRGAKERYYDPASSNLAAVLRTGEGNPVSLACVYMLTGGRLGLEVGGCNYPVHFLARAHSRESGELYMIDCYNEGRVIPAHALIEHHPLSSAGVSGVVMASASAELILSRVLRNLESAFRRQGLTSEAVFMRQLWSKLAERGFSDDF